jgi:Flp pilus assembly protein TadB
MIIVIAVLVVLAVVAGLAILGWRRARRSGALAELASELDTEVSALQAGVQAPTRLDQPGQRA